MKNHNSILGFVFCIGFCLFSCKKFVDIAPSPQSIATDAIFSNDNTALSAVDGVYAYMRSGAPSFANGSISIYTGLSADEIYNTSASVTYDPFYTNAILSNNTQISSTFWLTPYNIIYRTNAILEGLGKSTGLSDAVKKQLTGEMKVVRAFIYFNLTNLYGDVPLMISSDYKHSAIAPRTASGQIYQQILADLTDAQAKLTDAYPSTGKSRPNKATATALLARVYLNQKDWVNAEAQATAVISSGDYGLVADLNSAFLINSNETIWEIASPGEARNTAEGAAFIPSSTTVKPTFAISQYLLQAFEIGDKRKSNWLKSNTVSGATYYYPYKFKNRLTTTITEYEVVLRLAEQYLIRAEARAQQSPAKVADALSDINIIRLRAGLSPLSGSLTQAQCLTAIAQERRVELFTEWGNRWFDLKRWGNIDAVLGAEKTGWAAYESLYPIPYQQIQYNPNLSQNPGYN